MKLLHPLAALAIVLFGPVQSGVTHHASRITPFLGDVTSGVPLPVTGNWFIGLLGALGCVYLVLGVWSQARKLFSRRPPIDDDIRALQQSFKSELKAQTEFLTRRIDDLHQTTEELRLERERTWKAFQSQIAELGQQFAYLSGALGHKPKR